MEEKNQKLLKYYKSSYPFESISRIIPISEKREISFTLANSTYIRYNSFSDYQELAQRVEKLCPTRIDIGAVYHDPPTKGGINKPLFKELVFDIDLTDYPRQCCTGKTVCNECFVIIKAGMKILDFGLREELGLKKIDFFFSGGRGLHCWVRDRKASRLSDRERKAICSYFGTVLKKQIYPSEYREILGKYSDKDGKDLFESLFVRLDSNVTSEIKHLLKAPFCIHPTTEKVCVALSVDTIDDIAVEDIPVLDEVVANPSLLDPFISNLSDN